MTREKNYRKILQVQISRLFYVAAIFVVGWIATQVESLADKQSVTAEVTAPLATAATVDIKSHSVAIESLNAQMKVMMALLVSQQTAVNKLERRLRVSETPMNYGSNWPPKPILEPSATGRAVEMVQRKLEKRGAPKMKEGELPDLNTLEGF